MRPCRSHDRGRGLCGCDVRSDAYRLRIPAHLLHHHDCDVGVDPYPSTDTCHHRSHGRIPGLSCPCGHDPGHGHGHGRGRGHGRGHDLVIDHDVCPDPYDPCDEKHLPYRCSNHHRPPHQEASENGNSDDVYARGCGPDVSEIGGPCLSHGGFDTWNQAKHCESYHRGSLVSHDRPFLARHGRLVHPARRTHRIVKIDIVVSPSCFQTPHHAPAAVLWIVDAHLEGGDPLDEIHCVFPLPQAQP